MYQVNPTQLLEMIKAGHNPQQLIMSVLEGEMSQTPMGNNLLTLAKNKDGRALEEIARNISIAQGIDFDKEFSAFKQLLGLENK